MRLFLLLTGLLFAMSSTLFAVEVEKGTKGKGVKAVQMHKVQVAAPQRLNVLLITSEDTGLQLSCYGDKTIRTPHLDRLAEEGVRFQRAYVATASCSESRSAIFTGLFPHQSGQIGLATHKFHMFRNFPTIPSLLSKAGYRTGVIGKIHVNPPEAFKSLHRVNVSGIKIINSFQKRDVASVAKAAGAFMRDAPDQPFFLMVNYADTHLPFLRQQAGLPEKPLDANDVTVLPAAGIDSMRLRKHVAKYYNCIKRLDVGIGMLMDALDDSGQADNTVVIYLGDHGPQFSRGKLTCYELGLRVPMIIHWPGHAKGVVRDELVMSVDLLPTILEATGLPIPEGLAGRSLVPLLNEGSVSWRQSMFAEMHSHYPPLYFPQRVVRDDRYKLIVNLLQDRPNPTEECYTGICSGPDATGANAKEIATASEAIQAAYATWRNAPPEELYDLTEDPHELKNLADDPNYAEVLSHLRNELLQWRQKTADPLLDPAKLDQLTKEEDDAYEESPNNKPKYRHDSNFKLKYRHDSNFRWHYPEYLVP